MRLQGLTPERPLTHDLFASALEALERHGRPGRHLRARRGDVSTRGSSSSATAGSVEVDARPSDALALAVRVGAPIFAVESVLDQAGAGRRRRARRRGGEERRSPLESTGEQIVDPRLDVFRDFVNSLDVDPDAEGRGS